MSLLESKNVDENQTAEPSDYEKFKKHMAKHKNKYIIGGLVTLSFAFGVSLGNRGNSKRHYSKLLKDGVKDAVKEGVKDVVDSGMRDVVKDGMRDVVNDVVTRAVRTNVRSTVSDAVTEAIKESAVTILKEVEVQKEKEDNASAFKKILDLVKESQKELTFRYDSDGNVRIVREG